MSTPQRDRVDWVPVYNTTNETIPSGAVARVTGVTDGVLQLAKPTAAGDTKVIVVGLTSVPAGKYGRGTFDPRAVAAYDPADGPPAAADQLGSASGSWYLVAGNAGFRALGGAGNGLVNVVREAGSGTPSPLTTKGDVWGYSTTDARIPVGADGQVLTADSTQTLGVKWAAGGTVTSIVTKEVDGTPSYTFTSTISMEFDQADGFVLSQPAAGRVKFDLAAATATQAGIVSTAAQTFAGDKDFNDDVNVDGSLVVQTDTFLNGILDVTLNSTFRDYVVMQGVLTVADDGTAAGVKAGAPLFRTYDGYGNTGGYNGAFEVTADLVSYTNTTDRVIAMWGGTGATVQPGQCEINGVIKFRGIADADAPNSSLYYSTTASKLVYKDAGGTVNNLY